VFLLACKPSGSESAKSEAAGNEQENEQENEKTAKGEVETPSESPAKLETKQELPKTPPSTEGPETTTPYQAPLALVEAAKQGLRYVEQERCAPAEAFPTFVLGPSRWVHFDGGVGRVSAIVACSESNEVARIDIHPTTEPGRRYAVFYGEAGLAVEEKIAGRWSRRCDGGRCDDDVDPTISKAWREGYDRKQLAPAVGELQGALEIPKDYEALSNDPILAPGEARAFIVYASGDKLMAVRPDGSKPFDLGVPAPDPYRSSSRGRASDKPLLSPDGQILAHLDQGQLRLTTIADKKTRAATSLAGPVLIGPWSADAKALMVIAGEPASQEILDLETLEATPITAPMREYWWGRDAGELVATRRAGDEVEIVRGKAPDLADAEVIAKIPGKGVRIVDVRGESLALRGEDAVWSLAGPGSERAKVREVPELFISAIRLSPDAQRVAFRAPTASGAEALTAFEVAKPGGGTELISCSQSCNFYWYDATHVVVPGTDTIYLVGTDGERMVVAEEARGVMQRQSR
jgi:hypothetical protein